MQVFDHRIEVEAFEFLGVIKTLVHRVGQRRVLVEHPQVKPVWPPVEVRAGAGSAAERALAFLCHGNALLRIRIILTNI